MKVAKNIAVATTVVALASSFNATPAQAFSLFINPQFGSTENTGSTAKLDFNFVQQGADVLLNLGIGNTTNGTVGLRATRSTLVGVAFDLIDGVTVSRYNPSSSGFTQLWNNPSLPPYGTFDVGISPERNSFAGGNPQEGLTAGQSTNVSFLLSGNNLNAQRVETAFQNGFSAGGTLQAVGRFQQVNAGGGSDKVLGGGVTQSGAQPVPEPITLGGTAVAGGIGWLMKRKLKASEKAKA